MKKTLFIALFLASLMGPTLLYPLLKGRLDMENYENRQLAALPGLSLAELPAFPAEFEAYYDDHVPFKNFFVKAKTKLDMELLGESSIDSVTVGADHWMFYTVSVPGEDALADYQKTNLYPEEEMKRLGEEFSQVHQELKERGIRFFQFEAPNKESVYGQYMPKRVKTFGETSRLEALIPYLKENYGIPLYYLKDSLQPLAETQQLYLKYDSHWNPLGAFVASQQMAEVLVGSQVPLDAVELVTEGTCSGDLARMLSLSAEYSDDPIYRIEGYLPEIEVTCLEEPDEKFALYESNSPNDKTLLLVGDSFSQFLKVYLPKLYRRSVFVTFDSYDPSLLEKYQVDDFVYLTVERNQRLFEETAEIVAEGDTE